MLFVTLQSLQAPKIKTDGVELRLDCFSSLDKEKIRTFCMQIGSPVLFTLRKTSQGGRFKGTEESRLNLIEDLLLLKPQFVDLEWDVSPHFLKKIAKQYPETRMIISYHNFKEMPSDLDALLSQMENPSAYAYKIAAMAGSSIDGLRMLDFVKRNQHKKISGICMGQEGLVTRILGPLFGSFIDYALAEEDIPLSPGQLTASELFSIYHYHLLSPSTAIYGLIGDPIDQSISHLTHNAIMRHCARDAVYVKLKVKKEELPSFFKLARQCEIKGLSVTMPLKEELFSFIDQVDPYAQQIGAINTLHFKNGEILGFNTDGIGALNALEIKEKIKRKKIVLIGAGGAARAIAYEACKRGGDVTILNRTKQKALTLAKAIGCRGGGLDDFPFTPHKILIDATSGPLSVDPAYFIPGALVMDIKTVPKMPLFLLKAQDKGCKIVHGYEMFLYQALEQFKIWFKTLGKKEELIDHQCTQNTPAIRTGSSTG